MRPSMVDLANMTVEQLKNVSDLKIWNEFGSVSFIDKTDVTGVDLSDIITIKKSELEVYDDERHTGLNKPPVGQKLNKPAIITLYQLFPKVGRTAAQKEASLRNKLARDPDGAQHLSYDGQTGVWEFKVLHFTKWGADASDDEDEQVEIVQED